MWPLLGLETLRIDGSVFLFLPYCWTWFSSSSSVSLDLDLHLNFFSSSVITGSESGWYTPQEPNVGFILIGYVDTVCDGATSGIYNIYAQRA